MRCFLTSSPCFSDDPALNTANEFDQHIVGMLPNPCSCLFIASSPDAPDKTDEFAGHMKHTFSLSGVEFTSYRVLDRRTCSHAQRLIDEADFLILAGGHVPTQNAFFREIDLREKLRGYSGVIMGISAGTMNSAEVVYAHPELPGEATDPKYQKFLPGLGLTSIMILPHYQMNKDDIVDSLRIYEEIAYPDSVGRQFYALPDGSYLYIDGQRQELHGEAYLIENGSFRQISREGDIQLL